MSVGLPEIAKEAGANPLKCPHCGRSIKTDKMLWSLFESILERIREGSEVMIKGFGVFTPRRTKAKALPKEFGEPKGNLWMSFRNSRSASAFLNDEGEGQ